MITSSLTEKFLLDTDFLDWAYPPHRLENRISQTNNLIPKVISTIENPTEYDTSEPLWKKPLRVIARIVYIACTLLLAAPAGFLYHGFHTIKNLTNYKEGWDKVKISANNCFKDFLYTCQLPISVIFLGLGVAALTFTPAPLTALGKVVHTICGIAFPYLGVSIIGAFSVSHVVKDDLATSRHFALDLRKNYGLLNEQGGLLTFTQQDLATLLAESKQNSVFNRQVFYHIQPHYAK